MVLAVSVTLSHTLSNHLLNPVTTALSTRATFSRFFRGPVVIAWASRAARSAAGSGLSPKPGGGLERDLRAYSCCVEAGLSASADLACVALGPVSSSDPALRNDLSSGSA